MSKLGKKEIIVPQGVTVEVDKKLVKVKGPKGELELMQNGSVKFVQKEGQIFVEQVKGRGTQYQGLYRKLVENMIRGVEKGVEKKLEFNGIGYRANVDGGDLVLNVGYSHPVRISRIEGIEFSVNENVITVSGINKVLVGDIAAKIREVRPPDSYKLKGIKYQGEKLIKKEIKGA